MNYPWYHGKISRQAAEELLVKKPIDGAFLVRESESVSGAHVLSLWYGNMVHNFRVKKEDNKITVQASDGSPARYFSNIAALVEVFKQPGQGLPCPLREPVIKEESITDVVDSDDDERDEETGIDQVDSEPPDNSAALLLEKMSKMDTEWLDEEFCGKAREYLNNGFSRDGTRINTCTPATDLQELIVSSTDGLSRELKEFLKKINFLQELFSPEKDAGKLACFTSAPCSTSNARNQSNDVNAYDELMDDLARGLAGVKSLEMLAQNAHKEHANLMKNQQSQTRTFEVNTCGNFRTRAFLKVDITKGKLWFMKNENDSIEDSFVVDHDRILQFVKDPEIPKLTFKIDNKSCREYIFKDVQARENLCQLAQYMKNLHAPSRKELKQISVFVGTWNMGSAAPHNMDSWLKCQGLGQTITQQKYLDVVGHDIYAFGTQESSVGENAWISRLKLTLKMLFSIDYQTVAVHTLWGIRLVILAKPEHENRISHVEKSSVKTGIANRLGNKGGVGISFDFLSTSFCFINTHLTSGNEDIRKTRRQQNYVDILKGLNLGQKSAYDITNQFHHVFWFGDLNYRIDLNIEDILAGIIDLKYKPLIAEDQLKKERDHGNVFYGFHEYEINFPPTYRYKRGTRKIYEHLKVKRSGTRTNVPSWCDRVLWKSFPGRPIEQISYGCTEDIVTSDHSPVFASFEVPVTSQFVASQDETSIQSETDTASCKINITFIKAKVKTVSKTNFYLEFHSVCLKASEKSTVGKDTAMWDPPCNVSSSPAGYRYCEWDKNAMPELKPIVHDPEYLKEQHLMIAVKSESGDESYGECVLSLERHLFQTPQEFNAALVHGGIQTGEILGWMNIHRPKALPPLSKKPAVLGKPEMGPTKTTGNRKPALTTVPAHRPISYAAPQEVVVVPPASKKALSLGRQPNTMVPLYEAFQPPNTHTESSDKNVAPELPKRTKINTVTNKTPDSDDLTPPPLPAKSVASFYVKLKAHPATVDELLSRIGLSEYLSCLVANGFERLEFLENISDKDLVKSGVSNISHREQILKEVENLKTSGVFKQH